MSSTFRLVRGAAICTYDLTGRQVHMRMTGPLTPSVMRSIAVDISRVGHYLLAKSFVLDLEAAAMAIPFDELVRAPQYMDPMLRVKPLALVPPSTADELFREYAWAQAKLGLLRGVFAEGARARGWAEVKGESRLYSRTPVSAR
jgi:hypothetical protein